MKEYEVEEEAKYPESGPVQVVKKTVKITIDGDVYERGFNLDPSQNIEPHIRRFEKEIKQNRK